MSVTETSGKFSKTLETSVNADATAYQGVCFTDVPEGNYNIGVAIPDNYNATTAVSFTMDVKAGESDFVDFGAQSRVQPSLERLRGTKPAGGGTSPLLDFSAASCCSADWASAGMRSGCERRRANSSAADY